MIRILIVEDEKPIANLIDWNLTDCGYQCVSVNDGIAAADLLEEESFDLVLLDIMMPELDGIQVISRIRENSNIPVIFLTAKSEDTDMILGLNIGADDYITKPFNPVEVIARARSQLRRYMILGSAPVKRNVLAAGDITLDDMSREVCLMGEAVSLTPKEYGILKFLLENQGQVFSPAEIYSNVWKEDALGAEGTVAVHIRHLREKLEIDPENPRHIKVVWGQGYKIE